MHIFIFQFRIVHKCVHTIKIFIQACIFNEIYLFTTVSLLTLSVSKNNYQRNFPPHKKIWSHITVIWLILKLCRQPYIIGSRIIATLLQEILTRELEN
jgi:hypothetical protein